MGVKLGVGLVSPGSPLTPELLASWLVRRLAVEARDWVREVAEGFQPSEFRNLDALPATVWTTWGNQRLAEAGLQVSWDEVRWENAEAARVGAEQRQAEELARIEAAKQREREAELRELAARQETEARRREIEAGHAEKLRQLEHDVALSEAARERQRELLEREQRLLLQQAEARIEQARLQAEADAAQARQEAERAVWEHLLSKATVEEKIAAAKARAAGATQAVEAASAHEAELRRLELEERRETSRLERERLAGEQKRRLRQWELENQACEETARLEREQLAQKAERLRLEHRQVVAELKGGPPATGSAGGRDYSLGALSAARPGGQGRACARCGKTLLAASDAVGVCVAPGCDGLLCNACWTLEEHRHCRQHAGI